MTDVIETPGGSTNDGATVTGGSGDTATTNPDATVEELIAEESAGRGTPDKKPAAGGSGDGKGAESQQRQQSGTDKDRKPAEGQQPAKVSEEFEHLPSWAQKRIRGLEKENGDNRLKAKTAEEAADNRVKDSADRLQSFLDGFAKVMGLTQETDDRPKTIDEAMGRLEESNGQIQQWTDKHRQMQVRLAVWENAAPLGANTPELMDSAGFLARIDGLDPSADNFRTQLTELISAQVEANPTRFKAQPPKVAPPQSGGEFTGGPGGRTNDAELSIEDHIRAVDPVSAQLMR